MFTRALVVLAVLAAVLVALPATAEAKGSGENVKIKLKKPKGKVRSGDTVEFVVKVRNRTREPRSVEVELFTADPDIEVLERETVDLEARERLKLRLEVEMGEELEGRKVEVRCRAEDAEDVERVRVRKPEGLPSLDDWQRGKELYVASCASCHGVRGDEEIRDESLSGWIEVVLEGKDEDEDDEEDEEDEEEEDDDERMPAFPGFTNAEIRLMREYVRNPDRDAEPGPSDDDDADWLRGKDLYLASCAGCHGEKGDEEILDEDLDDWLEALREGEDDMPAFPTIVQADVVRMRLYLSDPDRKVEEPPPPPPPASVTYESAIRSLLESSCSFCHNSGSARGGVRTDTYAEAFAKRTVILDSVQKSRMPPGSPLSAADQDLLRRWVEAGAPEK